MTRPILLKRLSVVLVRSSATRAPVKENATATRIVNGSTKLSNCAASTRNTTRMASP